MTTSNPERRRFRFSLWKLLLSVFCGCLLLSVMRLVADGAQLVLVIVVIGVVCFELHRPKDGWIDVTLDLFLAVVLVGLLVLLLLADNDYTIRSLPLAILLGVIACGAFGVGGILVKVVCAVVLLGALVWLALRIRDFRWYRVRVRRELDSQRHS